MKKKIIFEKIIYIFLILQPFLDLLTSLSVRYLSLPITIGIIIRGLLLFVMLLYLIFFSKSKYRKKSLLFIAIFAVFSICYFAFKPGIFTFEFLKQELTYMFKYFFYPIVLVCIFNLFNEKNINYNKIINILKINSIIISLTIIIAVITKTSFPSYNVEKIGAVGWFFAANEIGAILSILFPLFLIEIYKKPTWQNFICMIIIIIPMLLMATKTAFAGIILPIILSLIYFIIKRKSIGFKPAIIVVGLLIITIAFSNNLPIMKKLNNLFDNKFGTTEIITSKEEKQESFLSDRNKYLKNMSSIYNNGKIKDKLLGTGFTNRSEINNTKIGKIIEMDIFDIVFRYGIIGFIIYFIPIIYLFIITLKKMLFDFTGHIYLYILIIAFLISTLSGHVFSAPPVSIYLIIISLMLYNGNERKKKHG